ncbi:MAG: Gfo/Idh/MocA family oxidoreductase [Candidatus Hydrogenedentota bacterium]
MKAPGSIDVTIIGAGMIVHDLLLPDVYHLQRLGIVGDIRVVSQHGRSIRKLKENAAIRAAFPGQDFEGFPDPDADPETPHPQGYREALAAMSPRQAVLIALPDQMHYGVLKDVLAAGHHILCVKPLVQTYSAAHEVARMAYERGLFIGVEYHKRFDTRALMARHAYRRGDFGEFVMGEAKMIEPYFYRHSNFQNWFTCENSDPFTYVGCHYVDLVNFITGLRPRAVSVTGVKGRFPNGNEGYMWANGRVIWENGAVLSVIDGLGYPDAGAGSNDQCLQMFCEGNGKSAEIRHDDQYRGVSHCYLEGIGCGGSAFNYVSPDFFRLIPWEGEGLQPVGYGYESVAANLRAIHRIENQPDAGEVATRQAAIRAIDDKGLIATPNNSYINELVTEAARLSIAHDGQFVDIVYVEKPEVVLR